MSDQKIRSRRQLTLSLDTWAVLAAFALAAIVRVGILKHIPW